MQSDDIRIRAATTADAEQLLAIYAPYVSKTAITFEYETPSLAAFQERIENTLKRYPYIVAEKNGEILGYAYTGAFVGRAAYDWAAEVSIYLKESRRGIGLGRMLYGALEELSKAQHILNLNACIGYPEHEDTYLTRNSVQFHAHLGYAIVGRFHKCGYKFGTWYDMVWMEKLLGEHPDVPAPLIPFPELRGKMGDKA
ncbi:GNAT family N-acetyltransferase [Butyricicoccus faecihominis]|uniref:GNAT family N-acetyltransferase n=1 Tax=Butyricicoccus faecihominis TaxID=1712515 RepID=UPI0024784B7B|nr:GNAT family N-acetyltransferase [Butyricicoccus faecihominis]MCQ5130618.1 GNAT family N-acetyltransferase [Butyricicoccus faecihominis]